MLSFFAMHQKETGNIKVSWIETISILFNNIRRNRRKGKSLQMNWAWRDRSRGDLEDVKKKVGRTEWWEGRIGEGSNQRPGERLGDANKREGREEEGKWEQTREISEHTAEKVTEVGGE